MDGPYNPPRGLRFNFHKYLFDASDILYSYALEVETNKGLKPAVYDIIKVYREVIRCLEELDVLLTSDVAGITVNNNDEKEMIYIPENKQKEYHNRK